jgi:hypothetical protein
MAAQIDCKHQKKHAKTEIDPAQGCAGLPANKTHAEANDAVEQQDATQKNMLIYVISFVFD